MFLKAKKVNLNIAGALKNVIILPEDVIYKEVTGVNREGIVDYLSELFQKHEQVINNATFYIVILWASEGHLNADIWTFDLKSWDYNTDINVLNFLALERDLDSGMVTNSDGFIKLAEIEILRKNCKSFEDFWEKFEELA